MIGKNTMEFTRTIFSNHPGKSSKMIAYSVLLLLILFAQSPTVAGQDGNATGANSMQDLVVVNMTTSGAPLTTTSLHIPNTNVAFMVANLSLTTSTTNSIMPNTLNVHMTTTLEEVEFINLTNAKILKIHDILTEKLSNKTHMNESDMSVFSTHSSFATPIILMPLSAAKNTESSGSTQDQTHSSVVSSIAITSIPSTPVPTKISSPNSSTVPNMLNTIIQNVTSHLPNTNLTTPNLPDNYFGFVQLSEDAYTVVPLVNISELTNIHISPQSPQNSTRNVNLVPSTSSLLALINNESMLDSQKNFSSVTTSINPVPATSGPVQNTSQQIEPNVPTVWLVTTQDPGMTNMPSTLKVDGSTDTNESSTQVYSTQRADSNLTIIARIDTGDQSLKENAGLKALYSDSNVNLGSQLDINQAAVKLPKMSTIPSLNETLANAEVGIIEIGVSENPASNQTVPPLDLGIERVKVLTYHSIEPIPEDRVSDFLATHGQPEAFGPVTKHLEMSSTAKGIDLIGAALLEGNNVTTTLQPGQNVSSKNVKSSDQPDPQIGSYSIGRNETVPTPPPPQNIYFTTLSTTAQVLEPTNTSAAFETLTNTTIKPDEMHAGNDASMAPNVTESMVGITSFGQPLVSYNSLETNVVQGPKAQSLKVEAREVDEGQSNGPPNPNSSSGIANDIHHSGNASYNGSQNVMGPKNQTAIRQEVTMNQGHNSTVTEMIKNHENANNGTEDQPTPTPLNFILLNQPQNQSTIDLPKIVANSSLATTEITQSNQSDIFGGDGLLVSTAIPMTNTNLTLHFDPTLAHGNLTAAAQWDLHDGESANSTLLEEEMTPVPDSDLAAHMMNFLGSSEPQKRKFGTQTPITSTNLLDLHTEAFEHFGNKDQNNNDLAAIMIASLHSNDTQRAPVTPLPASAMDQITTAQVSSENTTSPLSTLPSTVTSEQGMLFNQTIGEGDNVTFSTPHGDILSMMQQVLSKGMPPPVTSNIGRYHTTYNPTSGVDSNVTDTPGFSSNSNGTDLTALMKQFLSGGPVENATTSNVSISVQGNIDQSVKENRKLAKLMAGDDGSNMFNTERTMSIAETSTGVVTSTDLSLGASMDFKQTTSVAPEKLDTTSQIVTMMVKDLRAPVLENQLTAINASEDEGSFLSNQTLQLFDGLTTDASQMTPRSPITVYQSTVNSGLVKEGGELVTEPGQTLQVTLTDPNEQSAYHSTPLGMHTKPNVSEPPYSFKHFDQSTNSFNLTSSNHESSTPFARDRVTESYNMLLTEGIQAQSGPVMSTSIILTAGLDSDHYQKPHVMDDLSTMESRQFKGRVQELTLVTEAFERDIGNRTFIGEAQTRPSFNVTKLGGVDDYFEAKNLIQPSPQPTSPTLLSGMMANLLLANAQSDFKPAFQLDHTNRTMSNRYETDDAGRGKYFEDIKDPGEDVILEENTTPPNALFPVLPLAKGTNGNQQDTTQVPTTIITESHSITKPSLSDNLDDSSAFVMRFNDSCHFDELNSLDKMSALQTIKVRIQSALGLGIETPVSLLECEPFMKLKVTPKAANRPDAKTDLIRSRAETFIRDRSLIIPTPWRRESKGDEAMLANALFPLNGNSPPETQAAESAKGTYAHAPSSSAVIVIVLVVVVSFLIAIMVAVTFYHCVRRKRGSKDLLAHQLNHNGSSFILAAGGPNGGGAGNYRLSGPAGFAMEGSGVPPPYARAEMIDMKKLGHPRLDSPPGPGMTNGLMTYYEDGNHVTAPYYTKNANNNNSNNNGRASLASIKSFGSRMPLGAFSPGYVKKSVATVTPAAIDDDPKHRSEAEQLAAGLEAISGSSETTSGHGSSTAPSSHTGSYHGPKPPPSIKHAPSGYQAKEGAGILLGQDYNSILLVDHKTTDDPDGRVIDVVNSKNNHISDDGIRRDSGIIIDEDNNTSNAAPPKASRSQIILNIEP